MSLFKNGWAAALSLALWSFAPVVAQADGLQSLEAFMKNSQAGKAAFTQEVTSPPKNGQPARTRTSSGSFEFQRPGKFRFDYRKPFEQTIVADGRMLWMYDVDLNQVTQRQQAQALGSTPASILAAATDLQGLRKDFDLQAAPEAEGLQWVQAQPKVRDSQLQSVRVGFEGNVLAALDIVDSFGQRSLIRFTQVQSNPALSADRFQFVPPAGVDVMAQ